MCWKWLPSEQVLEKSNSRTNHLGVKRVFGKGDNYFCQYIILSYLFTYIIIEKRFSKISRFFNNIEIWDFTHYCYLNTTFCYECRGLFQQNIIIRPIISVFKIGKIISGKYFVCISTLSILNNENKNYISFCFSKNYSSNLQINLKGKIEKGR